MNKIIAGYILVLTIIASVVAIKKVGVKQFFRNFL